MGLQTACISIVFAISIRIIFNGDGRKPCHTFKEQRHYFSSLSFTHSCYVLASNQWHSYTPSERMQVDDALMDRLVNLPNNVEDLG